MKLSIETNSPIQKVIKKSLTPKLPNKKSLYNNIYKDH